MHAKLLSHVLGKVLEYYDNIYHWYIDNNILRIAKIISTLQHFAIVFIHNVKCTAIKHKTHSIRQWWSIDFYLLGLLSSFLLI